MNIRLIALTFSLILAFIGPFFQNCAKVNFSQERLDEEVIDDSSTNEDIEYVISGNENSNGDAYTGKVTRYIHWSQPGECGGREIVEKSAILYDEESYTLVKDECVEVAPVALDTNDILVIDGDTIQYVKAEYTLVLPASCEEIFEVGGAEGNGYYYVDPDGPSGDEYFSVYCDMDVISGGWTPWSAWGECSEQCDGGEQTRTRECRTMNCRGPEEEIRSCNEDPC